MIILTSPPALLLYHQTFLGWVEDLLNRYDLGNIDQQGPVMH